MNGTFANIAENIGASSVQTVYVDDGGNVISADQYAELDATLHQGDFTVVTTGDYVNASTGEVITAAEHAALSADDRAAYVAAAADTWYVGPSGQLINATERGTLPATDPVGTYTAELVEVAGVEGINGSINNTLDGINGATQEAIASIDVSAIEWNMPTFDFGDMATTALGAVNTGDITLGVNSAVDEASTSTTNAISAVINQLGGSADTGAIVLNVASNMTGVNGSINNVMEQVNGSIGNLSTTALGAVNTGTIVSGVDAAVAGIVGSTSGGSNGQ